MGKIEWIQSWFDIFGKQKEDFETYMKHKEHYLSEAIKRK